MRNAFLALQEACLTLAEVERFLIDPALRSQIVQSLQNEDVKAYWEQHFASLKESEQRFIIESSRNRLSAFLGSPYLKPIFSQTRSTIHFRDIMDNSKACLVSLSQNHLKVARKLFGALILTKLNLAILSRDDLPPEQRTPFTIFADEFPSYYTKSCLEIAAASRAPSWGRDCSFINLLEGGDEGFLCAVSFCLL